MSGNKVLRKDWRRSKELIAQGIPEVEPHKEVRVAFLLPDRSSFYARAYNEIKELLEREHRCQFSTELFVAGSSKADLLDRFVDVILEQKFDIILPIGNAATHAARRRTRGIKKGTPVVYVGTQRPTGTDLIHSYQNSRNNLVGITLLATDNILPIDLIPYTCAMEKRVFFVPYHEDVVSRRLLQDLYRKQEHLKHQYGCEFVLASYTGKYLDADFFKQVEAHDAVLLIEGALPKRDAQTLDEYCKTAGRPCYAGSKQIRKKGGVYAVGSDLEYVAERVYEMVCKIVLECYRPAELPLNEVMYASSFLYHGGHANAQGVSVSSHYVCAYEPEEKDCFFNMHTESKSKFIAYCKSNTLGLQEALFIMTRHLGKNVLLKGSLQEQEEDMRAAIEEDEEKQIYHIAVLMPYYSELCKRLYDYCRDALGGDKECVFLTERFSANGINALLMERHVNAILDSKTKFDAIVTIGKKASLAAKKITKKRKSTIPVIFTAIERSVVSSLVHSSKNSRNNLVGVAVVTPCQLMPIKLILRTNPNAKHFFIPYRQEACFPQMLANIEACQKIFRKRGCEITAEAFSGKRFEQSFLEQMKDYDAVIIPEGGTTISDRDVIIEYCKNANIMVHADGAEAVAKGALFATTSDIRVMAQSTVDRVKAVTKGEKKPADLETVVMTKMRKTIYGLDNASRLGVVLQLDDYEDVFECCVDEEEVVLPTEFETKKLFVGYCESNTIGLLKAFEVLTQHIESELTFHSGIREKGMITTCDVSKATHRMDLRLQMINDGAAFLVHEPFVPAFFVSGGYAIHGIIAEMKASGRMRPLTSVQFASSLEQAVGLEESLEHGFRHEATILEPVDPTWAIGYLKAIGRSRLKAAYLLYGEQGQEKHSQFNVYLERCCREARRLALDLIPVHVNSLDMVHKVLARHSGKRNAFLSFTHLIDDPLAREMVLVGREMNLLVMAPSLALSDLAPISIGMAHDTLAQASFKQYSGTLFVRHVTGEDLYLRCANEELLQKMGYEKGLSDLVLKSGKILVK